MQNIKYLVMDVDGTLTDGKIYMGQNGELFKAFSIKDGYGINDILPKLNIIPIIITGRQSDIVENRCKELHINLVFQGVHNKLAKLKEIIGADNLSSVAYIGDDLNDLELMREVKINGGIIGCPKDASNEIAEISDFVSSYNGGNGAVREFINYLKNS